MRLASHLLGLAVLPLAFAVTYDIQVGGPNAELVFSPEAIYAVAGDIVNFHFNPKNHSVTESSFASPCGPKPGGIDSGFMPVAIGSYEHNPTYTVHVNDTKPIWIYCKQAAGTANSHCGKGMVFAINCGPDGAPNSFTNFKAAALAVGASLATQTVPPPASTTWTAAYGGYTIPPPPTGVEVVKTITLQSSTWATTYTSYPNSPEPTPAALAGVVHKVIVGGGKLVFDPPRIDALPRDTVMFEFRAKSHSVTQSSFGDPCRRLTVNGAIIGFDSDLQPVADGATTFPVWNLTVTDTAPIWAYCKQQTPISHCGQGMVFAINSDETGPRNFKAFTDLAKNLNGTRGAVSQPTGTTISGAVSLRVGGVLALALTAVVTLLL